MPALESLSHHFLAVMGIIVILSVATDIINAIIIVVTIIVNITVLQ